MRKLSVGGAAVDVEVEEQLHVHPLLVGGRAAGDRPHRGDARAAAAGEVRRRHSGADGRGRQRTGP